MSTEVGRRWPLLTVGTRGWLTGPDCEPLPSHVREEIRAAGGPDVAALADQDVTWIEAVANGEEPDAARAP